MSFNVTLSSFIRGIFHRYEKEEGEENHLSLLADSPEEISFYNDTFVDGKKWTREKKKENRSAALLLFFSFFLFLFQQTDPLDRVTRVTRRNIFPIREEILFIDEILEAFVDKRRDSFLFKGNHNGSRRINRVAINKVTTECKGWTRVSGIEICSLYYWILSSNQSN